MVVKRAHLFGGTTSPIPGILSNKYQSITDNVCAEPNTKRAAKHSTDNGLVFHTDLEELGS